VGREQTIGRVPRRKKDADLFGQVFSQPFQEMSIGDFLLPAGPEFFIIRMIREI
jgi:hypothetical protein